MKLGVGSIGDLLFPIRETVASPKKNLIASSNQDGSRKLTRISIASK